MVMFLNGLNDLTNIDKNYKARVDTYLRNMKKANSFALTNDIVVIFALQPFLLEKQIKTPLKKRILELTEGAHNLFPFYDEIRKGLRLLHDGKNAHFLDFSHVFDREPYTTFTDIWHFSDRGHLILAQLMANEITNIIKKMERLGAQ